MFYQNYLNHKCIPIEDIIGKPGVNQKKMTDLDQVYKYACEDADVTYSLKKILDKELEKNNLSKLFCEVEIPLMFVLCELEENGVNIDESFLDKMSNKLTPTLMRRKKKSLK